MAAHIKMYETYYASKNFRFQKFIEAPKLQPLSSNLDKLATIAKCFTERKIAGIE